MDIRDHFAGLAMQAIMQSKQYAEAIELITDLKKDIELQEAIAILAYTQAEYMIQLRNKINKENYPIIDKPSSEIVTMVKDKINEQKKHLKSLEEYNGIAREGSMSSFGNSPVPNGIACPKCGEELMDSNPMVTLTSFPAQKNINCPKCDYTGYRIA